MAGSTLQDLTESAQKHKPVLKKKSQPFRHSAPKKRFEKRQTVTFDEDARREYLTGFSKRKQKRKQQAHDAKQARIRDEIRQSRKDAAEARKEQAAENVRAERRALGLLSDEEEEEEKMMHEEHDFENDERRAHVTVQEFDVDADWSTPSTARTQKEQLPPSSRRAARKEAQKDPPKEKKPTSTRPSGSLTSILEPDVVNASHFVPMEETQQVAPAKRAKTYMSAAERSQERKRQRERNHQQAEVRREANRARAKSGVRKKISATGKRRT